MVVRLLVLLLALSSWAGFAQAKPPSFLKLQIDNNEIVLGDTVVLEVSSTGLLDPIDFSPLDDVAEVLRQTSGTRIAVFGGEVVEVHSLRIELVPRRLGTVLIGPLVAGDVASNTVSVRVVEDRQIAWTPTARDIRLDQTISSHAPWLQQQLILDIRLRYRHPISEESVQLPDLTGFRVVPIYRERRTLDEDDGGWAMIAWRYLLFPERSGEITLAGTRFVGAIAKSRAERAHFDLKAEDVVLAVRPAAFAGEWWLVANDVSIRDEWDGDPRQLSAGDEIERTITVSADGVLAEQIPDVAMAETRGLAITPVGESRDGKVAETGSTATASFRFRVRALSPVPAFLDTVRLRWWNVAENHAEDAVLPARRIDIGIPDRDKLLAAAEAEPSMFSRLRDGLASAQSGLIVGSGVLALLAAAAVLIVLRRSSQDPNAEALRQLVRRAAKAARRGNIETVSLTLRRLSAMPAVARAASALRERFETEMVSGQLRSPARYAGDLEGLLALPAGRADRSERLPRL